MSTPLTIPFCRTPHAAIIRVTATAICGSDLHLYGALVPTLEKGDILGHEFMGEVVETGSAVARLNVVDHPHDEEVSLANQARSQKHTHVVVVDDLGNLAGIADLSPFQGVRTKFSIGNKPWMKRWKKLSQPVTLFPRPKRSHNAKDLVRGGYKFEKFDRHKEFEQWNC